MKHTLPRISPRGAWRFQRKRNLPHGYRLVRFLNWGLGEIAASQVSDRIFPHQGDYARARARGEGWNPWPWRLRVASIAAPPAAHARSIDLRRDERSLATPNPRPTFAQPCSKAPACCRPSWPADSLDWPRSTHLISRAAVASLARAAFRNHLDRELPTDRDRRSGLYSSFTLRLHLEWDGCIIREKKENTDEERRKSWAIKNRPPNRGKRNRATQFEGIF